MERGTLTFVVRVFAAGEHSVYDVVLSGVTDLHIRNQIEIPWNYAEVTEFEVAETDGRTVLEIVLWSEPSGITASCDHIAAKKRQV